jgi:hypothetical protein
MTKKQHQLESMKKQKPIIIDLIQDNRNISIF